MPTMRLACFMKHLTCIMLLSSSGICIAEMPTEQAVRLSPDHASGIYGLGEQVGWTIKLAKPIDTPCSYEIRRDNAVVIASGKLDPIRDGARIETSLSDPGMLYLCLTLNDTDKSLARAGAAVDPRDIEVSAPEPLDFDLFWEKKLSLLKASEVELSLQEKPSEREGVVYQTLRMKHPIEGHVHAQIAYPDGQRRCPAMVIFQWAGEPYPLEKSWVTNPASEGWLAINVQPHDVPVDAPKSFYEGLPESIKKYALIGSDNRDKSYFLRMYLGDYQAVDYITTHPKWNGETLLVTGASMGGQQCLCIAGLHPAVTHLIVTVPAGCDTNGPLHGRSMSYPNFLASDTEVMRTALYFDPVNFAPRIRAKSLVAMGFIDTVSHPTGIWAMFNRIKAPKQAVPLVNAPHDYTAESGRAYTRRKDEWLSRLLVGRNVGGNK